MAFEGRVAAITMKEENYPEAIDIINIIGEDEDRPPHNVAERLIIEAGKERAKKIKQEKEAKK